MGPINFYEIDGSFAVNMEENNAGGVIRLVHSQSYYITVP